MWWSPEFGGYRETDRVSLAVGLLANRGVAVPETATLNLKIEKGASLEEIATSILVNMVKDLLEQRL